MDHPPVFDPDSRHGYSDPALALIEAIDWLGPALGRALAANAPVETTYPRLRVVRLLQRRGSLTMSDIARELAISGATLTGLVIGLEHDGLAMRTKDKRDGRVTRVVLTDAGAAIDHATTLQPLAAALLQHRPRAEVVELLAEVKGLAARLRSMGG